MQLCAVILPLPAIYAILSFIFASSPSELKGAYQTHHGVTFVQIPLLIIT